MSARWGRLAQRVATSLSACPSTHQISSSVGGEARSIGSRVGGNAPFKASLASSSPSMFSTNMRSPMGFAASGAMPSGGCNVSQGCGMASDATSSGEDGDGSTPISGQPTSPKKAAVGGEDDDPPVIRGSQNATRSAGFPAAGVGVGLPEVSVLSMEEEDAAAAEAAKRAFQLQEYIKMDNKDPLELLLFAKDNFMKKETKVIPIPAHVREVMYRHRWDKALVDVRRSVSRVKGLSLKQETYTAMVAVGNFQGLFGLGVASTNTAQLAVAQAYLAAFNQLAYIPLYRGHTIYHRIDHSFHEMKIRLMPRKEGWGIKSSDLLHSLCTMIGIKNISIATFGRRSNKFYLAQCFLEALQKQSASYDGAEASGMYLREVVAARTLPFGLRRATDGRWVQQQQPATHAPA